MRRRPARCDERRPSNFCSSVVLKTEVSLYLTPSMCAQDPALAPAWIIEGIIPWHLNRGNFYVSGLTWEKAHALHPWFSFDDFWSDRERVYEYRNTDTKRFFAEFQCDPEKHAKILFERRLRREIKRLLDTDRPYKAPMGLLEPKPEPVEHMIALHEFMYRRQGIFDEGSS